MRILEAEGGSSASNGSDRRHRIRPVPTARADDARGRVVLADAARLAAVRTATLAAPRVRRVTDCLMHLAVRALRVPVAALTFVEADRQLLIGVTGLDGWWARIGETPIEYSLCRHVVASRARLVIGDTHLHPLAAANPLVRDLGVRAYAGAPVWTRGGLCIGAFAALAFAPTDWTDAQLSILDELALAAGLEVAQASSTPAWHASISPTHDDRPRGEPLRLHVPAPPVPMPDAPEPEAVVPGTHAALRLWRELQTRRVVRVCAVYLAAAWLVIDVSGDVVPPLNLPAYVQTLIIVLAGLGLPLVLAVSWAFDLTTAGVVRAPKQAQRTIEKE